MRQKEKTQKRTQYLKSKVKSRQIFKQNLEIMLATNKQNKQWIKKMSQMSQFNRTYSSH